MTVHEILSAWRDASSTGDFYTEFEKLTGFSEVSVKTHFGVWGSLRHETAEEIAEGEGVTVREGGFQAFLAYIKRTGRMPISVTLDEGYDGDPNPRPGKPWPSSEDCKGCDGRDGPAYPHRFGCSVYGARANSTIISVRQTEDGTLQPLDRKP